MRYARYDFFCFQYSRNCSVSVLTECEAEVYLFHYFIQLSKINLHLFILELYIIRFK